MIYVMSDLHGCYEEYLEALEAIDFKDSDQMYILGDIVDRGKEPIRLLQDMMMRSNVFPIIGNHEFMAQSVLRKLCVEITEKNADTHLSETDMENCYHWCKDGGDVTLEQFRTLSFEEKQDILDYLDEFSLFEEVRVNDRDFVLVHAGLNPFVLGKPLDEYKLEEVIFKAPDYNRIYFEDKYLVSGHKPTVSIDKKQKGRIIEMNRHIAIDCGCVFGLNLGVYCLNTGEKWYIESHKKK